MLMWSRWGRKKIKQRHKSEAYESTIHKRKEDEEVDGNRRNRNREQNIEKRKDIAAEQRWCEIDKVEERWNYDKPKCLRKENRWDISDRQNQEGRKEIRCDIDGKQMQINENESKEMCRVEVWRGWSWGEKKEKSFSWGESTPYVLVWNLAYDSSLWVIHSLEV